MRFPGLKPSRRGVETHCCCRMARHSNGLWPLLVGFSCSTSSTSSSSFLHSTSDVGRRRRRGVVLGLVPARARARLVAPAAHGEVRHGDVAHGGHERALVAHRLVRGGDGALREGRKERSEGGRGGANGPKKSVTRLTKWKNNIIIGIRGHPFIMALSVGGNFIV